MEPLVKMIIRAKLGPLPVPYIFLIVLIPVWTLFSSDDMSLLFSMCIIATTILKGSLLSYWALNKLPPLLSMIPLSGVIILQTVLLYYSLHSSVIPSIIVLLPSNVTGVLIILFHQDDVGDDKYNKQSLYNQVRRSSVIVIFSRSAEENYEWLSASLRGSAKVVPFHITNSNFLEFTQRVSQCTFAILYHTKRHGRVNITNVTDSLYDKEVDYLSQRLGRDKVIVVADDLDDSSSATKNKILANQTAIRDQTRGLFLFTEQEKTDRQLIKDKIQSIVQMMGRGTTSQILADLVLDLLILAPWFYFAVTVYNVSFLITTNLSGSFLLYYSLFPLCPGVYIGLVFLLVMMVAELYTVIWVSSVFDMVLLLQSVGTGAYAVAMVLC